MGRVQLGNPLTIGATHRAISMQTGHFRLADGSLLRVDIELGRFVGTLYNPEMRVETQVHGSQATVHAWADTIAARGHR